MSLSVFITTPGIALALAASTWHAALAQQPFITVSVTTLNMAKERSAERILAEWRAHPAIWNSDVLLLQEVAQVGAVRDSIAPTLAKEMHRYVVTSTPGMSKRDSDGLAIISRFPLTDFEELQLSHNNMVFHTRNRLMIAATIQTPAGALRAYDLHLDSRINARERLKQIEPVISKAARWEGPCLIGGDLNTNYVRWAGNVMPIGLSSQGRAIQAAMNAQGFTTPMVHSGPTEHYLGLRLDWIYTRGLQASEGVAVPVRFSDHRAVRMRVAPDVRVTQARLTG